MLEAIFSAYISVEEGPSEYLEFYSIDLPYAVLGRDILNRYHITLDGPNQTITIAR